MKCIQKSVVYSLFFCPFHLNKLCVYIYILSSVKRVCEYAENNIIECVNEWIGSVPGSVALYIQNNNNPIHYTRITNWNQERYKILTNIWNMSLFVVCFFPLFFAAILYMIDFFRGKCASSFCIDSFPTRNYDMISFFIFIFLFFSFGCLMRLAFILSLGIKDWIQFWRTEKNVYRNAKLLRLIIFFIYSNEAFLYCRLPIADVNRMYSSTNELSELGDFGRELYKSRKVNPYPIVDIWL